MKAIQKTIYTEIEEGTLISLYLAKLAKKKNFDLPVNYYYCEYQITQKSDNPSFQMTEGEVEIEHSYFANNRLDMSNDSYICYAAPTQNILQKWIRKVHNIHINILKSSKLLYPEIKWYYEFSYLDREEVLLNSGYVYDSYEDALENAMWEILKHYINLKYVL